MNTCTVKLVTSLTMLVTKLLSNFEYDFRDIDICSIE